MNASGAAAVGRQMIEAASRLLDALDPEQAAIACRPFPDDDERRLWFYTPTDHGGLQLSDMTLAQHRLVHQLVASGLSTPGYVTAAAIMGLENILDKFEGWDRSMGRDRGRDPLWYAITIFGTPSVGDTWGWRFGGHHLSLHFVIMDGEVVASTPNFFGANPADSPLLGPHLHRPLAAVEDLGRELFRALKDEKRALALISPTAPTDLITGNRSFLTEGDRQLMQPGMRDNRPFNETTLREEGLQFSRMPDGIGAADLDHGEVDIMRELIGCYLHRLPDALADAQASLVEAEFQTIRFAWAGGDERHQPHYYRIQGERLFIEYDNTQNSANHIHAVWRDLANDFGGDVLAHHYALRHVPPAHG